ncbi:uncharacterized protein LOC135337269 [Halichondria panicea]|uniref:uncharacterized protein LOC135337269 n=1 Tax=Halichondria panicea TaxID=6063 RepID=UPI00312B2CAA
MTMHSLQNCSLDIIMKISVIATVTLLSLLALASSAPGHHYQLDQLKNALQQQYHSDLQADAEEAQMQQRRVLRPLPPWKKVAQLQELDGLAKEARQQLNGIRNHGYQQLIDALQLQQDESIDELLLAVLQSLLEK